MNAHVRRLSSANDRVMPVRPAKHHLATVNVSKVAQRLVVFTPTAADIERLLPLARHEMGEGAATEVVHRVFRHNPDNFWAIARRENFAAGATEAEGYLAFLMLNAEGVRRLFDGTFVGTDPDLSLLCRQTETPAGIYVWGTYARGIIAGGVPLAFEKAYAPRYRDVPMYARAATKKGGAMLETLGFSRGARHGGKFRGNLYVFERGPVKREAAPIYDTYDEAGSAKVSTDKAITITVARTLEDFMRVATVRSAVYIGEQQCPYEEEFDGNDLVGINLLGYSGNEPIGCLRIRCFAGFAKLERLAVRKEFRSLRLGTLLMKAGVELCRDKGYRIIYGRAEKNLLDYYVAMGWRPYLGGRRRVVFSDHEYVEIVFEAPPPPTAITLKSDPYVLMRPEGRWHVPGILERSAIRPVSRPSVDKSAARASA